MADEVPESDESPVSRSPRRRNTTPPIVSAPLNSSFASAVARAQQQLLASTRVNLPISAAIVRAQQQLLASTRVNPPTSAAIVQAQQQLLASTRLNPPTSAAIVQAQQQLLASAQSAVQSQLRTQQVMARLAMPALRDIAAQTAIAQRSLEAFREAASRSMQRQVSAVLPLIQECLTPEVIQAVETAAEGLEDQSDLSEADDTESFADEISDETRREIEDVLSGFEAEIALLPPAVARRLWILWVQLLVLGISLQAMILLPVTAFVSGLMGSGALEVARWAGNEASKAWDRRHPETEEDPSEERDKT